MTILVVGDGQAATSVAQTLEAYQHPVQHCRTATMALPLLNHYPERYSLILCAHGVESDVLGRHLAELERHTPIVSIATPGEMESASAAAAPMCGVERTADGCHQLRCALSEASAQPANHPGLARAMDEQPVAFAYSAPIDQRR